MVNLKMFPKQLVFPINIEQEGKVETINEDIYRTRFISNLQIDRIDINKLNATEDTSIRIIPRPTVDLYNKRGRGSRDGYVTLSNVTETINNVKEFLNENECYNEGNFLQILKMWNKFDTQAKDGDRKKFSLSPNDLRDQLNKSKIYLIVKPIEVKPSTLSKLKYFISDKTNITEPHTKLVYSILPINNYENVTNQPSNRFFLFRDLIFQHKANGFFPKMDSRPANRGNRPYYFNRTISTDVPYEGDRPYQTRTTKPEDLDITDPLLVIEEAYIKRGMECEEFMKSNESVDEATNFEPPVNTKWIDVWSREHLYVFDFEYKKAELDTATFTNPRKYFAKTDKIGGKTIIPLFGSREEAEKLLLTVIEDLLEPFRRIQIFTSTKDILAMKSYDREWIYDDRFNVVVDDRRCYDPTNMDYLDEPYVFAYKNYPPNGGMPVTKWEKRKAWLTEKRKIKPTTRYVDHFENYDTTHKVFLDSDSDEPIPTSLLTKLDTATLETAISTKIIEMGLGDFLELWYHNEKQNGEILYIPHSNNSLLFKSTLGNKKFMKNIHNYQKVFHKQPKRKKLDYKYHIKPSINNNS